MNVKTGLLVPSHPAGLSDLKLKKPCLQRSQRWPSTFSLHKHRPLEASHKPPLWEPAGSQSHAATRTSLHDAQTQHTPLKRDNMLSILTWCCWKLQKHQWSLTCESSENQNSNQREKLGLTQLWSTNFNHRGVRTKMLRSGDIRICLEEGHVNAKLKIWQCWSLVIISNQDQSCPSPCIPSPKYLVMKVRLPGVCSVQWLNADEGVQPFCSAVLFRCVGEWMHLKTAGEQLSRTEFVHRFRCLPPPIFFIQMDKSLIWSRREEEGERINFVPIPADGRSHLYRRTRKRKP